MFNGGRLFITALLYVAFIVVFSILKMVVPRFDFIDVWFHSIVLQLVLAGLFWLVAGRILKLLGKRKE